MFPTVWRPSLDVNASMDSFFSDEPHLLLESGKIAKVPVMAGVNKNEGLLMTSTLVDGDEKWEELK